MMFVGSYLLTWGQLETAFASGFHNIAPHRRGPHIDPKDVSKTLAHLAKEWGKEVKKAYPDIVKEVDDLVTTIISAAGHRNTICHGIQGVITKPNDPEFVVGCWHKFHETRSTGKFPEQRFYSRSDLIHMITETEHFGKKVRAFTASVQARREKLRVRAE